MGPAWVDVTGDDNERRLDDPHDYVRLEVETALADDSVRVVPVLVGGARMPPANLLPESLAALTRRNAASLVDEHWRSTMEELVEVLERIREEVAPVAAPGSRGPTPTPTTSASEPRGRGDDANADRPGRRKRRTRAILVGVGALVVVGGVAAVAMSSGGDTGSSAAKETTTSPKSDTTTTPPTTTSPIVSYQVGDCVTANDTSSSPAQPCSEPHTHEVTLVTRYEAGAGEPWPGVDGFRAFADPICTGAFTAYVGVAPDQSQYLSTWLYPTAAEWADGSREIQCAITSTTGTPTSGSVKGSQS
jgi:hypothetical protein